MKRTLIILTLIAAIIITIALMNQPPPNAFHARLHQIIDGDSFYVITDTNDIIEIRLYGVDTPELHTQDGKWARHMTEDMLNWNTLLIKPVGTDSYNRTLAWINAGIDPVSINHHILAKKLGRLYLSNDPSLWIAANIHAAISLTALFLLMVAIQLIRYFITKKQHKPNSYHGRRI